MGDIFSTSAPRAFPKIIGVYIGSLNTKPEEQDTRRLLETTSGPVYVPPSDSDSGRVLFLRQGTLMAQPFDAHRLELSGEAVPVAEKVGSYIDYGFFSASSNGVLVYRTGAGLDYQPTWLDRQGRVLAKAAEPGRYNSLALSPDERRAAVSRANPENTPNWDIWLLDLERNMSTRLTYKNARARFPVWSADGSGVFFDAVNLYLKSTSGTGDKELLLSQPTDKNPPPVRRETGASCYIPWKIQRQKVTYGCCPCRAIESRPHSCARS
jgi:hypothetical protein